MRPPPLARPLHLQRPMLCKLRAATVVGIDAIPVEVEVDVSLGMPGFHLVGLPVLAVREGAVRIRAALSNSGFDVGSVRVTVNLAPADVRKHGAAFDLPIALGILAARKLSPIARDGLLIAGELSLDGRVKPIRGALSLARAAQRQGLGGIVVPQKNAAEAALIKGIAVYGVETLAQAAELLAGQGEQAPVTCQLPPLEAGASGPDFADVCGQPEARRAAEVAAAGGHNLMLLGPPGAGKTMIARRMASILPPMTLAEAIEATMVHSVAGTLNGTPLVRQRPFRAPHHTCSWAGLVGGGAHPRPGEVSLAHNGVLFLDELPEFQRMALEALRQPLEDGSVCVVRASHAVTFPARFMLVAAMNPCPCGYRGSQVRTCTCGEVRAERYRARVSGPLLDRFDLFVHVSPVPTGALMSGQPSEPSCAIAARVAAARSRQAERFRRSRIHCNAQMDARQLRRHVPLSQELQQLVQDYAKLHQLSARALHRTLRVARTLADLAPREVVCDEDVLLAFTMQQARWVS